MAILAADAVGYSRLMAGDDMATVTALDVARAVFRAQVDLKRGRVIDMAGDSVLAAFATAIGAVSAALAIQAELATLAEGVAADRRMRFRIGVHLGDVIEKADGSVYGDGVNIAARLEGLADPGGITVSDSIRMAVKGKLAARFEEQGEHAVKNIPDPLHTFRVVAAPAALRSTESLPEASTIVPDKPSIAVLPFNNMSGDPEHEFYADGMCEDVITLLSCVPSLFVIARNSTFAYKGRSPDVRVVARELGVRYVLEGSVRKSGKRIRVTAQFIDAESGNHIWADKWDREVEDIFAVQDELAQGIVGALQSRLLLAELRFIKRKPPALVDAWGNVVQAKVKLFAFRRLDLDEAEPYARRAIAIDADYGEAHAVLCHILGWRSWARWTDDWLQSARDSVRHGERALLLAPDHPGVLSDVGAAYFILGRFQMSAPLLTRAHALDSNSAMTCAWLGRTTSALGHPEEAAAHIKRAYRLSPKDPLEYLFDLCLGYAEFFAGKFDLSRQSAERSLAIRPDLVETLILSAASCVRLNRLEEARTILSRVDKIAIPSPVDNLFRARIEGTVWGDYLDAVRQAMGREPL